MSDQSLLNQVRRFFFERPPEPSSVILVAVSAGQDSCALLHALASLRSEIGISLIAAHLNHGIRGSESDGDQAFAGHFAESLGVPFETAGRDVKAYAARSHLSIQEAARELRKAFLLETADRAGAQWIALGHTRDDHIETVLLNLLRGSGIDGLKGLPAASGRILRPLVTVARQETESYCREHGIPFREDRSNRDWKYARNRIREELLPNLSAYYNPAVREALLRLSESASADSQFLRQEAEAALAVIAKIEEGARVNLEYSSLNHLHVAIRRRVLRLAIERIRGHLTDVDFDTIEAVLHASEHAVRCSRTLRGTGIRIVGNGRSLRIERIEAPATSLAREWILRVPGVTEAFGGRFTVTEDRAPVSSVQCDPHSCLLDADRIHGILRVRARRPGDRIQPLGMRGTRKIQDILVDDKTPVHERDWTPILADDSGIVWIVGHKFGDRAKVTPKTRRVLRIRYEVGPPSGALWNGD